MLSFNVSPVLVPVHCSALGGAAPPASGSAPWRWLLWWCSSAPRSGSWWPSLKTRWTSLSEEAEPVAWVVAVLSPPGFSLASPQRGNLSLSVWSWRLQSAVASAGGGRAWQEWVGVGPPSPLHSHAPTHPSDWDKDTKVRTARTVWSWTRHWSTQTHRFSNIININDNSSSRSGSVSRVEQPVFISSGSVTAGYCYSFREKTATSITTGQMNRRDYWTLR